MNDWCMVSAEALASPTNHIIQCLADGLCDVGVSHDGVNRLFTSTPQITAADEQYVFRISDQISEASSDAELVTLVGGFLKANDVNRILIASAEVLTRLFYTPQHRLWCGNYETLDELQKDYTAVFGEQALGALVGGELAERAKFARSAIFNLVAASPYLKTSYSKVSSNATI